MTYEVMLGIDKAARDTGERVTMRVSENDPLSAAIAAERLADEGLRDPSTMYSHAMRVREVKPPLGIRLPVMQPVALAA